MPNQSITDPNAKSFAASQVAEVAEGMAASPYDRFTNDPSAQSGWGISAEELAGAQGAPKATAQPEPKKSDENKNKDKPSDAGGAKSDASSNEELLKDEEVEKYSAEGRDAGRAFAALKKERKHLYATLKQERDAKDAAIKALESAKAQASTSTELATIKAELETARKERSDMEGVIKSALYQHSDEFIQKFEGRRQQTLELAKATLPGELFSKVEKLLSLPPGEYRDQLLSEAYENLPRATQGRVDSLLLTYDQIGLEQKAEIADAGKRYEQWQTQRQAQAKTRQAEVAQILEEALVDLQDPKNGMDIFFPSQDAKDEADRIDALDLARKAWGTNGQSLPPKQLATLIGWGAGFKRLLVQTIGLREKLAKAEKEIAALKSATPNLEHRETNGGGDVGAKVDAHADSFSTAAFKLNPSGRF